MLLVVYQACLANILKLKHVYIFGSIVHELLTIAHFSDSLTRFGKRFYFLKILAEFLVIKNFDEIFGKTGVRSFLLNGYCLKNTATASDSRLPNLI